MENETEQTAGGAADAAAAQAQTESTNTNANTEQAGAGGAAPAAGEQPGNAGAVDAAASGDGSAGAAAAADDTAAAAETAAPVDPAALTPGAGVNPAPEGAPPLLPAGEEAPVAQLDDAPDADELERQRLRQAADDALAEVTLLRADLARVTGELLAERKADEEAAKAAAESARVAEEKRLADEAAATDAARIEREQREAQASAESAAKAAEEATRKAERERLAKEASDARELAASLQGQLDEANATAKAANDARLAAERQHADDLEKVRKEAEKTLAVRAVVDDAAGLAAEAAAREHKAAVEAALIAPIAALTSPGFIEAGLVKPSFVQVEILRSGVVNERNQLIPVGSKPLMAPSDAADFEAIGMVKIIFEPQAVASLARAADPAADPAA